MKKAKRALQKRRDTRSVLERILDTPDLQQVVPRLQPDLLHRVIESCGLEDCAELVMLATPVQLACILDLDLWHSAKPGMDEQFDAGRFGIWLEVLAESGSDVAAQKLTEIDADLVIAGLAHHARVLDRAVVTPYRTTDGVELTGMREPDHVLAQDIGGYRLIAKRTDSWEAIVAILVSLDETHPDYFHHVMRGCRALSNSTPEPDGLDDLPGSKKQSMFDVAIDRERRRDKQGYVTPAQACAFLEMSRCHVLGPQGETAGTAALTNSLVPRDLRCIQAYMQFVFDTDHAAYEGRNGELTYIANALIAGCSLQGRPFTPQEASDAAVAVCNLGLENWPPLRSRAKSLPDDFLIGHDLITVFQVGWTVLHKDVCMYAAERLLQVLGGVRCRDHDIQTGFDALRRELSASSRTGMPWRARDAMDVIAILDMPAWAALLGLIDECPVLHAALAASRNPRMRSVSASAFEFISDNSQIRLIREFMQSLPETLRP